MKYKVPVATWFCLAVFPLSAQQSLLVKAGVEDNKASSSQTTSLPTQPVSTRYVIQRQDSLSLNFPFAPELNEVVTVSPDGFISLLNANSLYVQGRTVPEVVESVKGAYSGILLHPDVSVDVKDFQKPFYTVVGEVNKPGKLDLRTDLTVSQAIAEAGGLSPTAKTQIFVLHRQDDSWYHVEKLNVREVMTGKNTGSDQMIHSGDMIYVPEKFIVSFKKYVPYSFNLGSYFQLASIP